MTAPNRLPLWEVMYEAFWQCPKENWRLSSAYMIRALRNWLVPEEPPTLSIERQRLRALLTAEADRARRRLWKELTQAVRPLPQGGRG